MIRVGIMIVSRGIIALIKVRRLIPMFISIWLIFILFVERRKLISIVFVNWRKLRSWVRDRRLTLETGLR